MKVIKRTYIHTYGIYYYPIQAVREVRDEAGHLLEQIKLLSSKNDDLRAEKARSDDRIKQLNEEVEYEIATFFFHGNNSSN